MEKVPGKDVIRLNMQRKAVPKEQADRTNHSNARNMTDCNNYKEFGLLSIGINFLTSIRK